MAKVGYILHCYNVRKFFVIEVPKDESPCDQDVSTNYMKHKMHNKLYFIEPNSRRIKKLK